MNQRKYSGTNRGFFLLIEISVKIFTLCRKLVPFWRFKIEKKNYLMLYCLFVFGTIKFCVLDHSMKVTCVCVLYKNIP